MRVSEVVERDAVALRSSDDVRTAAALLVAHHRSAVPVVDGDRRVVGSVCDADLLRAARALLGGGPGGPGEPDGPGAPRTVAEVMAAPVPVHLDDDVELALSLLRLRDVRCLAVVDQSGLVGVVTRERLLAVLTGHDPTVRRGVLDALVALVGPAPQERWDVRVDAGVVHLEARPGVPEGGEDRELAAVLARTVPGVVDVVHGRGAGPAGRPGSEDGTGGAGGPAVGCDP